MGEKKPLLVEKEKNRRMNTKTGGKKYSFFSDILESFVNNWYDKNSIV